MDNELEKIGWAFATLKSSVRDISIGKDVPGCEHPVKTATIAAKVQIERIRASLIELERLLNA